MKQDHARDLIDRYRSWAGWQFDGVSISSIRLTLRRGFLRGQLCRCGPVVRQTYFEPRRAKTVAVVDFDGTVVRASRDGHAPVELDPQLAAQFIAETAIVTNSFSRLPALDRCGTVACEMPEGMEYVDLSASTSATIRAWIDRESGALSLAQILLPNKIVSYKPVLGSRVTGGRIVIAGWASDVEQTILIERCELNAKIYDGELPG